MRPAPAGSALGLRSTVFRDLPVLPYLHWRPTTPDGRLEGGPVFPPDAPDWVHLPMHGGRAWVRGPEALPPGVPTESLPGRFAFVGPAEAHFGHMVGEFLHRLWILREQPGLVPLLVASGRRPGVPRFVAEYLSLIGAAPPVLVERPARVAELVVAEPGRLLGAPCPADYGECVGAMLPPALLAPQGEAKRLAILRGHLQTGRCVGEAWIEQALAAEGYRIFRPEAHSLAEQIAAVAGAERIVMSEGSALHLFDLLPPVRAEVAVLGRRPGMGIVRQCLGQKAGRLALFRPAFIIGTLHRRNPRANALSFVDPDDFLRFLQAEGFIGSIPSQRFLAQPGLLEQDIEAYAAHWRWLCGERAERDFIAAAQASCMNRQQDPALAAALRKPA